MSKGQSSIEYVMVIAFGLLIMLPITYYAYNYAGTQTDETVYATIKAIGDQTMDISEQVYYLGNPSKMTFEANFPDSIKTITILGKKELVFKYGDLQKEVVFISKAPIVGPFRNEQDNPCTNVGSEANTCWSKGIKQVSLEANSNNTVSLIIK